MRTFDQTSRLMAYQRHSSSGENYFFMSQANTFGTGLQQRPHDPWPVTASMPISRAAQAIAESHIITIYLFVPPHTKSFTYRSREHIIRSFRSCDPAHFLMWSIALKATANREGYGKASSVFSRVIRYMRSHLLSSLLAAGFPLNRFLVAFVRSSGMSLRQYAGQEKTFSSNDIKVLRLS